MPGAWHDEIHYTTANDRLLLKGIRLFLQILISNWRYFKSLLFDKCWNTV